MKRAIGVSIIGLLLVVLALSSSFAQTSDTVTVTVNSVAMIQVPGTTSLNLAYTGPGGNYNQANKTDAGGFEFSHNSASGASVTAKATKIAGGTNDITLKLKIGAEGNLITLVDNGSDVATPGAALSALAAGAYTEDMFWTADGTLANTPQGSYSWTVTFTVGG